MCQTWIGMSIRAKKNSRDCLSHLDLNKIRGKLYRVHKFVVLHCEDYFEVGDTLTDLGLRKEEVEIFRVERGGS